MRKKDSLVTYLNRLRVLRTKKFFIAQSRITNSDVRTAESELAKLTGIREGTIFAIEHETTYGARIQLEKLRQMGLIAEYGEGPQFSDYPKINFATIVFYNDEVRKTTERARGYSSPPNRLEHSLLSATYEAIERHASQYIPTSRTIHYPKIKRGDATFVYPLIPHFGSAQTTTHKFLPSSADRLKDILGFDVPSLTGGKKRFLPLNFFYYGRQTTTESMPIYFEPTSSGSGAGASVTDARLSAIYELIERDHFLLHWLSGAVFKEIYLTDSDTPFSQYVEKMKQRYNLEIYFFDLQYDLPVHTCLALIIDPVLNIVSMGAKTSQDPEWSLEGALLEAIAVLDSIRQGGNLVKEGELHGLLSGLPYTNPAIDMDKRVRMYCSPHGITLIKKRVLDEKRSKVSFSDYTKSRKSFPSKERELRFILDAFVQLRNKYGEGYEVYCHELSSVYSKELGCSVAHVFVPALLKLYLTEPFATPLSERLTQFMISKKIDPSSEKSLVLPHFFP